MNNIHGAHVSHMESRALSDELARLRHRPIPTPQEHAQLQQQLDKSHAAQQQLQARLNEQTDELRIFTALFETAPDGIGIANMHGIIEYANPSFRAMSGYGNDLIGMHFLTLYPQEDVEYVSQVATKVTTQGSWQGILRMQRRDATILPVHLTSFLIHDVNGQPAALTGMFRDLTEQQQIEQERAILQQQLIEAQQKTINELSSPLLPIADRVIAIPLIGTIDTYRAKQVMKALLDGVEHYSATVAILDITGIQTTDEQVATTLMQAAQAARLLGAQVVLTGVGPHMAHALVHLGSDLNTLVTRATLQDGIAYALSQGSSRMSRRH